MKLSVIIVNWNTQGLLAQCLRSLEMNTAPWLLADLEVFVVDNASRDGSVQMIRSEFAHVHLLQNEQNVGFASANNQAIRESNGQYLLLLNPDTRVHTGALEAMVEFLDAHPDVGAAGSRLLDADGELQLSCSPLPTLSRELWRLLRFDLFYPYAVYRMHTWSMTSPRQVDVVQGASFMVRRSTFEEVGVLDETYFMYTEEVDLCYRIQRAGWQIYWLPASKVTHYGGQSTRQVAATMFLHLYSSKLLYFRKHYGGLAAFLYKLILYVTGLLRVLLGPLIGLVKPSQREQYRIISGHYQRLLLGLPNM